MFKVNFLNELKMNKDLFAENIYLNKLTETC
jgi:hypothetical protein